MASTRANRRHMMEASVWGAVTLPVNEPCIWGWWNNSREGPVSQGVRRPGYAKR